MTDEPIEKQHEISFVGDKRIADVVVDEKCRIGDDAMELLREMVEKYVVDLTKKRVTLLKYASCTILKTEVIQVAIKPTI